MTLELGVALLALFVSALALIEARGALLLYRITWDGQRKLFEQLMDEAKFSSEQRERQWVAMYQLNTRHEQLVRALKAPMELGNPKAPSKPN